MFHAMGFHLHRSNRVERLVARLAELFEAPLGTVWNPEAVVVPGRGMSVWLSMQLSRRLGVWATPLVYPRALVERVVTGVLGERALGPEPLSEELIEWAVRAALPGLLGDPAFAPLARYLEDDRHGVRLTELSARIASVFDQYLTYRPHWIRSWEGGGTAGIPEEERWQITLWRRVAERTKRRHVAHVATALMDRLSVTPAPPGLPVRLSVFGLSTLPPLFVQVMVALSRHIDVHFFLFAPSPARPQPGAPVQPLLSSLGRVGAELEQVLTDTLEHQGIEPVIHDEFERPAGEALLDALHAHLFDPAAPEPRLAPLRGGDASISLHACHGPMREVEVLHDQLLALLTRAEDPVRPEEVLVLVPELEAYAPLVEAVFRRDPSDERFLPFRVSDRALRREAPLFDAFLALLGMVRGRVTASEVIDLFMLDSVRKKLGIESADADVIREWIVQSGVRWGIDADHRAELGLPRESANTWRFGLSRLLLGYALPCAEQRNFAGLVGFDEVEGKDAELLGTLAGFLRTLFGWLKELERPRPLSAWSATLGELLAALFADDPESLYQVAMIRRALEELMRLEMQAEAEAELDIAALRDLVERRVNRAAPERGFLAGGIGFSSMVPMRSVPFRVIALLGMNDAKFPRSPRPIEFDLLQGGLSPKRELADRSSRDDDRYLFLETLAAARERLIVTYTGKSMRDDRSLAPSVCVSELLDTLAGTDTEASKARRSALVVSHRLQGFSPAYFDGKDPRLFSYAVEYEKAANSLRARASEASPFLRRLAPPPRPRELGLDEIVRFWNCPPAYLLNRQLGVYLKQERTELRDREPLELEALDEWKIGEPLIGQQLAGLSLDDSERIFRGKGLLPFGAWGRLRLETIAASSNMIAEQARARRGGTELPPLRVEVPLAGELRVTGTLYGRFPNGRVEQCYSRAKAKRLIALWIRHLAACAAGSPAPSVLIERDKEPVVSVLPVVEQKLARERLAELAELYLDGQARVVPFVPEPSAAYVRALGAGKSGLDALAKADATYERDPGEIGFDAHADLAFDHRPPPFDAGYEARARLVGETEFHRVALLVFEPLFAHVSDGELLAGEGGFA
ncbi:MAG TPA: exodeoxyribonuclease V subunit gamma [Polyangiaceae bacterium]